MIAHRTALAKALLAIVLFGTVPASISVVGLNSPALGIVRLTLAAAGMSAMLGLRRGERGRLAADYRRARGSLVLIGAMFGLHWLTYFLAIKAGSPSMSELGFSTYGAQLPLLGWLCGFGRPSAVTLAAVGLGLAGAVLTGSSVDLHSTHAASLAWGVLSGTLYAALPLLHQRHAAIDGQLRTWAQFVFALPLFLALAPWSQWSFSLRDVLLVLHLSLVVTLVGHYLWVQATTVLPIQVTGVVAYLQLPTSLAMNALLLGLRPTPAMLAGAACIVAANLLTVLLRSRRRRTSAPGSTRG
ncbi:MAG TPA: DMT family transporter [Lacipirellulaceae bacterium]|nr:DMT family transporter [Lacipirellulaceae bacterium]